MHSFQSTLLYSWNAKQLFLVLDELMIRYFAAAVCDNNVKKWVVVKTTNSIQLTQFLFFGNPLPTTLLANQAQHIQAIYIFNVDHLCHK